MSSDLKKTPFGEELLPRVQAFDCGELDWQREVSDWIKAPAGSGGALDELRYGDESRPGSNQVWIYYTAADGVIGFGSLSVGSQRYPSPKSDRIPVSVIPNLAVDQRFWGQPPGPPEDRYSARILDDLIHEALAFKDERPILVLYVHIDNVRGLKFYERAGFKELHKPYIAKDTGRTYKRLALVLGDQFEPRPGS